MIWKVVTLVALAVSPLVYAKHVQKQQDEEHQEEYAPAYPSYEFSYKVEDPHTHDFKGQKEMRDGSEVKGEYWLLESDGRKRIVKYTSDKHKGFHAIVEYLGYKSEDQQESDIKPVEENQEENNEDNQEQVANAEEEGQQSSTVEHQSQVSENKPKARQMHYQYRRSQRKRVAN